MFGQVLIQLLRQSFEVVNLDVLCLSVVVVTKHDVFDVRLFPLDLEVVLEVALHQTKEPSSVLVIDQPIVEDTLGLVNPQTHQGLLIVQVVEVDFQDSLEHLTQVTQVEGVVRLGRSG